MTVYLARVGRDGSACDQCRERIPPRALCWMRQPDTMLCERCARPERLDAFTRATARFHGDRTPETP